MKIILILIDGLGDEPIPALGNKTPLEVAETPNLDFMAKNGRCGLVKTFRFPEENEPTSEGAHIALFGYEDNFLGRGAYEAMGIGIKLKKTDVALRVNFAFVFQEEESGLTIVDRRAGRIEKTQPLIKALSGIKIQGITFLLKKAFGHRAVLVMRGKGLSKNISDGDSHAENGLVKNILPLDDSKEAKFTAEVLNQFLAQSHQILENSVFNKKRKKNGLLPANFLLIRRAGQIGDIVSFKNKYGLRSGFVAGGGLYKGMARILGMKEIKVKGATGFYNTNLKGKISAVKKNINNFNFIFCHIKATDTFAHDGDFQGKKDFIEKIDKNLKPLLNLKNTLIVVTGDHSTCSLEKDHCCLPVPIFVYGEEKDLINKFSERDCLKGSLGTIKQEDFMQIILNYAKINNNKQ